MANVYNRSKSRWANGNNDWLTTAFKLMLVTASYVYDPDHDFVDEGGANDPIDHEISIAGYVAGHGNSGRHTFDNRTVAESDANDRGELKADDEVWTSLGPASGGPTIAAAIVVHEATGDDLGTELVFYLPITPQQVNSSNFTLTFSTNGGRVAQLAD